MFPSRSPRIFAGSTIRSSPMRPLVAMPLSTIFPPSTVNFIERASFMAVDEERAVGAILVTLLPEGDPCDHECYEWRERPPADCIEKRLGRPHLTWIFAAPHARGNGIGTALLAATVNELLKMGFQIKDVAGGRVEVRRA